MDRVRVWAKEAGSSHRCGAACSEALAAAGVGDDVVQIDSPSRTSLRTRALDWLRADFDVIASAYTRAAAPGKLEIGRKLRNWLTDEDLSGVRDEAIVTLPEDERRPFQKLWR